MSTKGIQMTSPHLRKPSKTIVQTLATNVRTLRQARNISQEELAGLAGLHRTYVGSVERGERNATLSTLEAFASALNVSVLELLAPARERHDKTTK